jgi:hypothetical protein
MSSALRYDDFKRRYLALRFAAYRASGLRDAEFRYLDKCAYDIVSELEPDLDLVFFSKAMSQPQQEGALTEEEEFMLDAVESALNSARQALISAGIRPADINRRYDRLAQNTETLFLLLAQEYSAARQEDPDLCLGEEWEYYLLKLIEES